MDGLKVARYQERIHLPLDSGAKKGWKNLAKTGEEKE